MDALTGVVAFQGAGNTIDRAEQLTEAIKQVCYETAEGLSLALVIGCLEIAKAELLDEAKE